MKEPTLQDLIAKAKEHKIGYESVKQEEDIDCEFISCDQKAVLNLNDFDVCISHGFRLIKCLTEKIS